MYISKICQNVKRSNIGHYPNTGILGGSGKFVNEIFLIELFNGHIQFLLLF